MIGKRKASIYTSYTDHDTGEMVQQAQLRSHGFGAPGGVILLGSMISGGDMSPRPCA